MPVRKLPAKARARASASSASSVDALAEAENAAAEAEARAEAARKRAAAARSRAAQLKKSDSTSASVAVKDETQPAAEKPESQVEPVEPATEKAEPIRKVKKPKARPVAAATTRSRGYRVAMAAAAVVICASLGATGFMLYHHHTITRAEEHKQSISAEANAAARQIVVTLMTLDAKNAAVNIRQVIDNSTGQFREQMESGADEMIKSLQKAQVSTRVRVGTTAVESVSDDSAVVLVAAYSELNAPDSPDRKPRSWQIALTLNRDAGVLKLSKIDFL